MRLNKLTVQLRLSITLCVIATLIFSVVLYTVKGAFFTGVSLKEIHCEQNVGKVPYSVADIQEKIGADGKSTYTVCYTSEVEGAPPIKVNLNVIPADMSLGTEYMVDWVHTFAVYDKFVRDKDIVSMEYTGTEISEETMQQAKNDVKNALATYLKDVVKPIYKWFAVGVLAVNIIVCIMLTKISSNIAEKWAAEDVWSKLQAQLDETMQESKSTTYYGMDTSVFVTDTCIEPNLPFRFWADDEEFERYLKKRNIAIDLNDMTKKDNQTMKADYQAVRKQNRIRRNNGVLLDINVGEEAEKPIQTVSSSPLRKSEGVRRRNLNSSSLPKSTMPQSSLGKVRKLGTVSAEPKNVNFKTRLNTNIIQDIEIGDLNENG